MRTVIFRRNYYAGLAQLEPGKRLEAYDAIMRYAFEGERTDVSPECAPVLAVIFDSIDADFRRFERKTREEQGIDD